MGDRQNNMQKRGIVLILLLIGLAIFLFYGTSSKNVENQDDLKNRDIKIIDDREIADINIEGEDDLEEGIIVFGNNYGEMCLDLKSFLDSEGYSYINYSPSDSNFYTKIEYYKKNYKKSEGMSLSFGYYPIVFIGDRAFSGFDNNIKEEIKKVIDDLNCEKDLTDI